MIFNSILSFAIIWKKIFVKTSTYFITKSVEFIISTCFMPDILIASILAVLCAQQKQNITAHSIDWANEFNKSASFHALKSCIECNPVVITFLGHRLHKIDSFAWRIWLIICFISSSNRFKPIQRLYLTGDKKNTSLNKCLNIWWRRKKNSNNILFVYVLHVYQKSDVKRIVLNRIARVIWSKRYLIEIDIDIFKKNST